MITFKQFLAEEHDSDKTLDKIDDYLQTIDKKKMHAYCSLPLEENRHGLLYASLLVESRKNDSLDKMMDPDDPATATLRAKLAKRQESMLTPEAVVKEVFKIAFKDPKFIGVRTRDGSENDTLERSIGVRSMAMLDDGWYNAVRHQGVFSLALFWKP